MIPRISSSRTKVVLGFFVLLWTSSNAFGQFGPILTGSGAPNRSMAGVAVANPLSPSSALYWNPATLSGFDRSEVDFGAELLKADSTLSSSYAANAFGKGISAIGLSGRTKDNSTVFPLPNAGIVYRPDDSPITFGMSLNAMAGFGVDYPAGALTPQTNPILSPRAPAGLGVGPVYADYQVFQINPAISYQVTDELSIGIGPNISLGRLQFTPGFFFPPDDANKDGFASYPTATNTRTTWGAGFSTGVYYKTDTWAAGVAYKSRQWSEPYRYNTVGETGVPRTASLHVELPNIVSVGFAYLGIENLVLSTDVRYFGFHSASGFGPSGYAPSGAALGLGFRDSYAVATGAQYRLTEKLVLRGGYSYGTNPVPESQSSFNIASPTIIQHIVTTGLAYDVTDSFTMSLAYLHGFDNSIQGPFQSTLGPVAGTNIRNSTRFDSLALGAQVKFGPSKSVSGGPSNGVIPANATIQP